MMSISVPVNTPAWKLWGRWYKDFQEASELYYSQIRTTYLDEHTDPEYTMNLNISYDILVHLSKTTNVTNNDDISTTAR